MIRFFEKMEARADAKTTLADIEAGCETMQRWLADVLCGNEEDKSRIEKIKTEIASLLQKAKAWVYMAKRKKLNDVNWAAKEMGNIYKEMLDLKVRVVAVIRKLEKSQVREDLL